MKKPFSYVLLVLGTVLCYAQPINQLIAEGQTNIKRNHWEQAYTNFQSIIDNHGDDLTYFQRGVVYNHLGFLDLMFLEPERAERNLNLSILYHEEGGIPNERVFADALANMGMLYLEQAEFDLSRRYIQRALDILIKKPEYRVDYLIARTKLARIYEEAGSYTLALSIYNESYDQLVAMGNELSPDFADICSHKGRILMMTGQPTEGEKFINLSATIYESLGSQYNVQRAESMEDLALFYERMGRFDQAERMLIEILELKRSIPDEADILIIETLNDLGIMYHQLGQMSKARKMFEEVIVECEENVGTNHPFYATAKNNLGTIALSDGDFVRARDMFEDALEVYKEKFGIIHPYYANTLNNLARVERKLGNIDRAEGYYKEVLKIDSRIFGENHPNYATTLLNIGVLFSASGREAEAEEYYAKALRIREIALGLNHPSYGSALEYMGMHYLATGNMVEAEKNFRKSIDIQIKQIRSLFPIMTDGEREAFYNKVRMNVERYHAIAAELLTDNPELVKWIFDFQEKTKAILFNTLDHVHDIVADSEDEVLQAKYQQWLADKRLLSSYYQMPVSQLQELHVNLELMEANLRQEENYLQSKIEEFEEALPHDKLSWETTVENVKEQEAVVEIIRINEFEALIPGEKLFGFTANTRYLAIIFAPGKSAPTHAFLGKAYVPDDQHLADYNASIDSDEQGADFYKLYWEPVKEAIGKATTVRVVPDGIYYSMNPNLLSLSNNQYVLDHHYVSYITSVYDLTRTSAEIFNNKAYFFGDPDFNMGESGNPLGIEDVTYTAREVNAAGQILAPNDWKVTTYMNTDASELRLSSAYNPTILHIASPGYFGKTDLFFGSKNLFNVPQFNSGLFLTGASSSFDKFKREIKTFHENDGLLTSFEILNLNLHRTRLVILSALNLTSDKELEGEGYYGLLKSLMVAGTRNIIASPVKTTPEVRVELMELFYKKFVETDRIQESLKYAQQELRKKYEDPTTWGSFMLIGSGS